MQHPTLTTLFRDISSFVRELQDRLAATGAEENAPDAKRRKLNGNEANENDHGLPNRSNGAQSERMKAEWSSVPVVETSFSVPQRKKLLLQISRNNSEGIRALNPATKGLEFGTPWKDIG